MKKTLQGQTVRYLDVFGAVLKASRMGEPMDSTKPIAQRSKVERGEGGIGVLALRRLIGGKASVVQLERTEHAMLNLRRRGVDEGDKTTVDRETIRRTAYGVVSG